MKRTYRLIVVVAALGAAQAAACTAEFRSCGGDSCSGASAGQSDDVGEGGVAGDGAAGDGGATAITAKPQLFGACSKKGSVACEDEGAAERLECDGTRWQAGVTCPGGKLCVSTTGECSAPVAECADAKPGQVVCREDKLLTCGADLVTATEGQQCTGTCLEGICQTPSCGDHKVEAGEECDDGGALAGDGCSLKCTWEPIAIALGDSSSCALSAGGTVKCWGDNAHGALGLGDHIARGARPGQMGDLLPALDLGKQRTAKAISYSVGTGCALLDDGSAKCWGNNQNGQLGTGDQLDRGDAVGEMGDDLKAIALGKGRFATGISVGGYHACALLDDGTLKCWGSNSAGQLGQDDASSHFIPEQLKPVYLGQGRTALAVSVGAHEVTCVRLDDSTGKCWGYDGSGELSANSSDDLGNVGDVRAIGDFPGEMELLERLSVGGGHGVQALSIGLDFTCGLLDDGSVKCWGRNNDGQLGQENTAAQGEIPAHLAALPMIKLGSGRTAKSVTTGDAHACAVLDDGSVKCWGDNEYGQLGVGASDNRGDDAGEMGDALEAVPLGHAALQVAAGRGYSCALLNDGSVVCWGLNDKGQLGIGNTTAVGNSGGLAGVRMQAVDLAF